MDVPINAPKLEMTAAQKAEFEAFAKTYGWQEWQFGRVIGDERYESMSLEWLCRGYFRFPAAKPAAHTSLPVAAQESSDTDPNAPWLSLAHMICAHSGIAPGHIMARLEALRDKLEAAPAQGMRTITDVRSLGNDMYWITLSDGIQATICERDRQPHIGDVYA